MISLSAGCVSSPRRAGIFSAARQFADVLQGRLDPFFQFFYAGILFVPTLFLSLGVKGESGFSFVCIDQRLFEFPLLPSSCSTAGVLGLKVCGGEV